MSTTALLLAYLHGEKLAASALADHLEEQGHPQEAGALRRGVFLPVQHLWLAVYTSFYNGNRVWSAWRLFKSEEAAFANLYQNCLDLVFQSQVGTSWYEEAVAATLKRFLAQFLLEDRDPVMAELAIEKARSCDDRLEDAGLAVRMLSLLDIEEGKDPAIAYPLVYPENEVRLQMLQTFDAIEASVAAGNTPSTKE